MALSGYFSPQDNFVPYLIPFKYLSHFKWAYQLLIENEFSGANISCMNPPDSCNPLESLDLSESMAVNFAVMASLTVFYGILGFLIVYKCIRIKV